MNSNEYQQFSHFLNQQVGINLGAGKEYLINNRLRKIMKQRNLTEFSQLLAELEQCNSPLRSPVIDAMTTNETLWFRDEHPYDILQSVVLPNLLNPVSPPSSTVFK